MCLRRTPGPNSGWRRLISSHTAMARMPGDAFMIGTILGVPNAGQRIGPPPPTRHLLLRRQPRIVLDPIARRRRDTRFGGGDGGLVALSETHVQPHLVVGDVTAGQVLILLSCEEPDPCPNRSRPPDSAVHGP